jgi:hypothetical protein
MVGAPGPLPPGAQLGWRARGALGALLRQRDEAVSVSSWSCGYLESAAAEYGCGELSR